MELLERYLSIRQHTEKICQPLQIEDYVVQPIVDVSPPKWHLGHTTWFFETMVLVPYFLDYQEFDVNYNYVFNSYYESVGARVIRTDRGNLSRPTVEDVYRYRQYVDEAMRSFLKYEPSDEIAKVLELGFHHEQQHQELLWYDIKYILGHNPLFPIYHQENVENNLSLEDKNWIKIERGLYDIGHNSETFCFDNELGAHQVHLNDFQISSTLVSNADYLEFMENGGYHDFQYWHSEGWDWVNNNHIKSPLYWHLIDGEWHRYSLGGLKPLKPQEPVCHVSYYEASAYAAWKKKRLPTEFEWEAAAQKMKWGHLWEWTESAYLPYPGFQKAPGALGEYNGKFMINQMVLRGASIATSPNHQRITYRNFFHPNSRWHFNGIRLAK